MFAGNGLETNAATVVVITFYGDNANKITDICECHSLKRVIDWIMQKYEKNDISMTCL